MFTEEFLDSLPEEPILAGYAMCEYFFKIYSNLPDGKKFEYYDKGFLEALGAFEAYCEASGLSFDYPDISNENKEENIKQIVIFFRSTMDQLETIKDNITLEHARNKYRLKFGTTFMYEFSDGDLERIQSAINELRAIITNSEIFDANHQERILKKLESLQQEIHKRVSSLAKFWDLMGEAGVALGKFGNDAKPFVDRVREIAQIVWRTQARAEELPSGTPFPLLKESNE